MALPGCRGVSRVLEKLENSLRNGEYYEAHQMYRTLYFRYLGQKKYKELKDMLYQGSVLFLDANQNASGADLGTLLIEVLDQSDDNNCESWSPRLATIFLKIGPLNCTEREIFLGKAIKWSAQGTRQGHPTLHQHIAKIYWNELNYVQARQHYVQSEDGKSCGKLLIEFQLARGFKSEVDLCVAQVVLQFLCLRNQSTANQTFTTYTENHPRIGKIQPPYLLPLLNFIWFLLRAVETKKLQTFAVLCQLYQKSIERDPCYLQYLDKIGQIFFGVKPPKQKKSGGVFGSFIESFLGGLEDESDDETKQTNRSEAASTSTRFVESADLD